MDARARREHRRRWPWVVGAIVLALVAFLALFDWNMLRGPVERYASNATGRTVSIGHLDLNWHGLTPRVVMNDVTIGNPEWAGPAPLGHARELSFTVRLSSLFTRNIILPNMRLADADVNFMRDAQSRANWHFRDEARRGRRNVQVLTVTLDNARLAIGDDLHDLWMHLQAHSEDQGQYKTHVGFAGTWRGGDFEGTADTGSIVSLRGSTEPFPIRIVGKAGKSSIRAEGEVADITRLRHIDADFAISGPSLASLYSVLKLSLPDTPPYQSRGRLTRNGDVYRYTGFRGKIGSSDVFGDARYELRKPRNLLTAQLASKSIDVADLGPLIGAGPRGGSATPRPAAPTDGGIFPDKAFNLEKLNTMDADVQLTAGRLRVPAQNLLLQDVKAHAVLVAGQLTLDPMNFDFAGGRVQSKVVLDATKDPLAGRVVIDASQLHLARFLPESERLKTSTGRIGGQLRLNGRGNSIDALMSTADGSVSAAMTGGRISELAVWLVNLQGGQLLQALFGGDHTTPIRCAATALDVTQGIARVEFFVFDTEQSRIGADGTVNLAKETLNLTLHPRPKNPGILSLRGPVHIVGPLRQPHFQIGAESIARGVGAVALGFINPLLALIPLIETGPGEDAPCRAVLNEVRGAAQKAGPPAKEEVAQDGKREAPAPITNVPPRKAQAQQGRDRTLGQEEPATDRAPIVDIDPKQIDASKPRQAPAPIVNVPVKK